MQFKIIDAPESLSKYDSILDAIATLPAGKAIEIPYSSVDEPTGEGLRTAVFNRFGGLNQLGLKIRNNKARQVFLVIKQAVK
jgi:hypothetical protein